MFVSVMKFLMNDTFALILGTLINLLFISIFALIILSIFPKLNAGKLKMILKKIVWYSGIFVLGYFIIFFILGVLVPK